MEFVILISVLIMVGICCIGSKFQDSNPYREIADEDSGEIYEIITTDETRWCPFCECDDIFSGSWYPETCQDCGAVYHFGCWQRQRI